MTAERDIYVRAPECLVVYADGIVWRLENEVCRMMLYRETLEPNEDGDILDKHLAIKTIIGEIRMPRESFRRLTGIGARLFNVLTRADEITEGIDDEGVNEAYWNATNHVKTMIFDSATGGSGKIIDQYEDKIEDLSFRVNSIKPDPRLTKEVKEARENATE